MLPEFLLCQNRMNPYGIKQFFNLQSALVSYKLTKFCTLYGHKKYTLSYLA